MQVETYEVTEMTTEGRDSFEIEAEAQALIEEMGLDGQKSLLRQTDPDVGTKERIPYRLMTNEERGVYKALYPETATMDQYAAGPIPLRVLQVGAHAVKLFDKVEVWFPSTSDPDPLLVGCVEAGDYLLARWGDALAPFEDLKDRAIKAVSDDWVANAQQVIEDCRAFIAAPEALVRKKLRGGWVRKPWT